MCYALEVHMHDVAIMVAAPDLKALDGPSSLNMLWPPFLKAKAAVHEHLDFFGILEFGLIAHTASWMGWR